MKLSLGYAYNSYGIRGVTMQGNWGFWKGPALGLGNLNLTVSENQIVAPTEMYMVADTRPVRFLKDQIFHAGIEMDPWKLFGVVYGNAIEAEPPHAQGYNMLFADTHVDLVKRKDYLFPPRSAHHWNRDNQPHPESWSDSGNWAVQN